jgi:hypothetical protein
MMETEKRAAEQEILAKVRTALAPLACDPLWSLDHDRLGFLIRDEKVRRGMRFAPVKMDLLERDDQFGQILNGIRGELARKGFALPK